MELLHKPKIINVGARNFHDSLAAQGADSVHVDWKPPAGGDREAAKLLDRLAKL
ncbi:MAG: fdrA domain protein [Candidatus Hadarchaeota archaeon]|nr:fdrA domain protein [Candidatus Hadarchaeota archaeon]